MSNQFIIDAINCIHSPQSTTSQRNAAYNTCETFKSKCENLPLIGLALAVPNNSAVVRHFGYQLLDHYVKFNWAHANENEKKEFKTMLVNKMMEGGTLNLPDESTLIRNILSSLVTEILKRDWPQQWLDFLTIVKRNVEHNTTTGEVLLSSMARLVEDIELDTKLTPARRGDLLRSVGLCKDQLVELVASKLQEAVDLPQHSSELVMTCTAALNFLSAASSMTWFHVRSLYEKTSHVCTLLFLLLRNKSLRQSAADVLYNIAARKTTPSDNAEFTTFMLQDDAMKMVFDISNDICSSSLSDDSVLFLKTLCRTYTEVGENHISGIVRNDLVLPKEPFQKYLQLMLIFYQNKLISIRSIVIDLWVHFLNFDQLKVNQDLLMLVPHIVQATCKYFSRPLEAAEDVLDNFELLGIYNKLLSKMISLLDMSGKLCPNKSLEVVFEWQQRVLSTPIPSGRLCKDGTEPFNTWKFFSVFTEKIISACLKSKTTVNIEPVQQSLRLLLEFDCIDPLVSYFHVSSINGYVPTFKLCDNLTIPILEKLFYLLGRKTDTSYPGVTPKQMDALVSDLHRHSSSLLLRFVTNYPTVITWEVFQAMQTLYDTLLTRIDNQRYGSMLLILEALISGSNNIPDLEKQIQYIRQLISPLTTFLDTPDLVSHSSQFAAFLHLVEISPSNLKEISVPIRQIKLCSATLCAISKRFTKDGSPKPAFQMVFPYIERVFAINKQINKFWCAETYKDYPWLKGTLEPDRETKMIYCTLLEKRTDNTPTFRMNMVALTDYANQLVDSLCDNLASDVYKWAPFPNIIMDCYAQFLSSMQMSRVKAVLHSVIKPYLVNCPIEEYGLCLPVLQVTLESVYKRLSAEWEQIQTRKRVLTSDDYSEDSAELDEIFNDHMVLIVTREYCELLAHFFRSHKKLKRRKSGSFNPITEHLLKERSIATQLLMSVFSCMAWGDGVSSNRACAMAHNALKLITLTGQPLSDEATKVFLVKALQALQIHGQHDNCMYTLLNVVISIIQLTYHSIPHVTKGVLSQIPNVIPEKIDRFFNTLVKKEASERNLRDSLQSVVSPIISRPISEAGKQHYKIQDLAPLLFQKTNEFSQNNDTIDGLHSLFSAAGHS